MPNPDVKWKISVVTALVLPVVAVKLATVILGQSGPTAAQAVPAPAMAAAPEGVAPSLKRTPATPQQIAAAEYIITIREQPFGPAPLLFDKIEAVEPVTTDIVPDQSTPSNEILPIPKFTLSAVMASATGQRALINGRPYLQGETIERTTWSVESINASARSVILRDSRSNRQVVINVELPN